MLRSDRGLSEGTTGQSLLSVTLLQAALQPVLTLGGSLINPRRNPTPSQSSESQESEKNRNAPRGCVL